MNITITYEIFFISYWFLILLHPMINVIAIIFFIVHNFVMYLPYT